MLKPMAASAVRYLVVHCSATPAALDIGLKEIDRWHRERGMLKCGYHFIIRRSGAVEIGRPLTEPGAHAAGFNGQSIGICMVGGVNAKNRPEDNFTPEQYATLTELLRELRSERHFKAAIALGHRDLSPDMNGDGVIDFSEWKKACPSFDVRAWINQTKVFQ